MKKILTTLSKRKLFSYCIIVICLTIAGFISYSFAPKQKVAGIETSKPNITTTPTSIPSVPTETVSITISPTSTQTTLIFQKISFTPAVQSPSPTITKQSNTIAVITQPTSTPIPTTPSTNPSLTSIQSFEATLTPTPTQITNTVSLQIQTPDGTTNSTITLKNGATVCDVLDEAKNEGKIASVTFDDSYMASLHSKYVSEINGYKNNWTFTVNGNSPLGCSLSNPKPNDSIVWKFG